MEIKTAEDFLEKKFYFTSDIKEIMIEFAKYHVTLALEEIYKKATLIKDGRKTEYLPTGSGFRSAKVLVPIYKIDKSSILNAYPLDNIV